MRTHDFVKFRLDPSKFIGQDRLEQLDLPREMRVERFFANAQFRSQIIHRDTAEPVTEKVSLAASTICCRPASVFLWRGRDLFARFTFPLQNDRVKLE